MFSVRAQQSFAFRPPASPTETAGLSSSGNSSEAETNDGSSLEGSPRTITTPIDAKASEGDGESPADVESEKVQSDAPAANRPVFAIGRYGDSNDLTGGMRMENSSTGTVNTKKLNALLLILMILIVLFCTVASTLFVWFLCFVCSVFILRMYLIMST